jgi:hypothetical protein
MLLSRARQVAYGVMLSGWVGSFSPVIARQRVRPKAGPMTGSGGRSSNLKTVRDYWMPRFRGA